MYMYMSLLRCQTELDYDHAGYLPRIHSQRTIRGYDDGITAQRARSSLGVYHSPNDGFHYEEAHRERYARLSLDQQVFNGQVIATMPVRHTRLRRTDAGSPM